MAYILVIDDEPQLRGLLRKILADDGHTVDTAENGKTGLKLTNCKSYDLVITDIIMPEQDGFEVMKEIRQKSPEVGIIAITGGTRHIDPKLLIISANHLGAKKVIAKPIDFDQLKTAVNEVLQDMKLPAAS